MRNLITMFIILSFLIGTYSCREKNKVELIRVNNNSDYKLLNKENSNEKTKMGVFSFDSMQIKQFNDAIEQIKMKIGKDFKKEYIAFNYKLYINEKGRVDKVVSLSSMSEEIDRLLADKMSNWEMNVFSIGYPFKYAIDWSFTLSKPEGGEKFSLLSSTFPVNEAISKEEEDSYFIQVEQMPSPLGGIKTIQGKIHYPELAKRAGIEGRVYIKAYINEKGNVTKTEIIKGLDGGCNEEAVKAVKSTKFIPGRQRGKAVKTQVVIPILFKLDSPKETDKKK